MRGLARYFNTTVKTIQNRIGRLARTIIPTLAALQLSLPLQEHLVADGLENFCVSQDFPNNIHLLVGKDSQYTYGFNYALMRRKGRKTQQQQQRCEKLYPLVDFTIHTIKKTFSELVVQMKRVAGDRSSFVLFTDERRQYQLALGEDGEIRAMEAAGEFSHVTINSKEPRTVLNDLFSVNYIDREVRKDHASRYPLVNERHCFSSSSSFCSC